MSCVKTIGGVWDKFKTKPDVKETLKGSRACFYTQGRSQELQRSRYATTSMWAVCTNPTLIHHSNQPLPRPKPGTPTIQTQTYAGEGCLQALILQDRCFRSVAGWFKLHSEQNIQICTLLSCHGAQGHPLLGWCKSAKTVDFLIWHRADAAWRSAC